ncbi:MAG TPA: hypothetical protein VFR44_10470 [Actinomycetota bacterium]|nr:hypothetical protein [Actinomycetota bacterium]
MIARERLAVWREPEAEPRADAERDRSRGALEVVLAWLPFVALSELLLIRTFYRVGIHIPKDGPFRTVYAVLTDAGSFALNLSSVLAVVALALLAMRAWRSGRGSVAIALGAMAALATLLPLAGVRELGPVARLAFVIAVIAVVRPALARAEKLHRVALVAAAATAVVSSYAGFSADAAMLGPSAARPVGAVAAQLVAEALAVVSAFAFLGSAVRSGRVGVKAVALGAVLALALLGAWAANGAITGILVIWTAGLRLYLPMWLYLFALWAFGTAAAAWLPERRWRTAGAVLLLVGGVTLGTTYQQALVVIGLLLLADGVAVGGLQETPTLRAAARAERHGS